MVVEGDHRGLLPSQKTGGGRHAGLGRVKDAAGAAKRGMGVPILSRTNQGQRALARSFRAVKLMMWTAHRRFDARVVTSDRPRPTRMSFT